MAKIGAWRSNADDRTHAKRFFCVVSRICDADCLPVLEVGKIATLDAGCCSPRPCLRMGNPVCIESGGGYSWRFFDYSCADSLRGGRRKRVHPVSSGRCRILSFLSKQIAAPVLFVLVLDCLIARRFRKALIFIAGEAGSCPHDGCVVVTARAVSGQPHGCRTRIFKLGNCDSHNDELYT